MDINLIITLITTYISLYGIIYYGYIYLTRNEHKTATLFHPRVTIIIPAHNEEENIANAINSIKKQDYNGRISIIVMNDASTDNTKQIAESLGVKVITTGKKPIGKTRAVNKGLLLARTPIVGVLDADSYLDEKAIKEMIGEFENPIVGAVTPIVKVHKPKKIIELMQMVEYLISMSIRKLTSNTNSLFITHGVGALFRTKALKEVGLFEENTLTEDLNIGLKLFKKGYKIKSVFSAIGYTVVPKTIKGLIKQRMRWTGGLIENTYKFKDILLNKNYGNAGLFILPLNLLWVIISLYVTINMLRDFIKSIKYLIKDLILTHFDWKYIISNYNQTIIINELTLISIISLIAFLLFYTLISRRLRLTIKESIISYLIMPLYFTLFLILNSISTILTPIYLIKKGGKPWLSDKG